MGASLSRPGPAMSTNKVLFGPQKCQLLQKLMDRREASTATLTGSRLPLRTMGRLSWVLVVESVPLLASDLTTRSFITPRRSVPSHFQVVHVSRSPHVFDRTKNLLAEIHVNPGRGEGVADSINAPRKAAAFSDSINAPSS